MFEWININDKKPIETKTLEQYLVVIQDFINCRNANLVGETQYIRVAIYHPKIGFHIDNKNNINEKITHWCELPKLPKQLSKTNTYNVTIQTNSDE